MADGAAVTGWVVTRRVLGKQLAFATLAVKPHAPAGHNSGSPPTSLTASAAAAPGEELKLCFAADTWDASSEAPFPDRRSLLQVGSLVTVETHPEPGGQAADVVDGEAATVVRWTIHEQGGGRAAGRISTVGLATAAPTAHGSAHRGSMWRLSACRFTADAVSSQDAMATIALTAAEGGVGLCGAWALLGTCGCNVGTVECPYRHAFTSPQERATAQKLRARNERYVRLPTLDGTLHVARQTAYFVVHGIVRLMILTHGKQAGVHRGRATGESAGSLACVGVCAGALVPAEHRPIGCCAQGQPGGDFRALPCRDLWRRFPAEWKR